MGFGSPLTRLDLASGALSLDLSQGPALQGVPSASAVPIIRVGTEAVTLTINSESTISWPAFPSGLSTVLLFPGDVTGDLGSLQALTWARDGVSFRAYSPAGAPIPGAIVRVNYLAVGW
jgi:hypothetical protein